MLDVSWDDGCVGEEAADDDNDDAEDGENDEPVLSSSLIDVRCSDWCDDSMLCVVGGDVAAVTTTDADGAGGSGSGGGETWRWCSGTG